jgi:Protein of unknown function (DUF998)
MRTASIGGQPQARARWLLRCGVAAGPVFVAAFMAEGVVRDGYRPLRHPVSSLALGSRGWIQAGNFAVTGALFLAASAGLARAGDPAAGSRAVPALIGAAGAGLIGSAVFATDPVSGYPPGTPDALTRPTRAGTAHNLAAVPVFVGLPAAALACGWRSWRAGQRWFGLYSAGTAVMMLAAMALAAAGFGQSPRLSASAGCSSAPASSPASPGSPPCPHAHFSTRPSAAAPARHQDEHHPHSPGQARTRRGVLLRRGEWGRRARLRHRAARDDQRSDRQDRRRLGARPMRQMRMDRWSATVASQAPSPSSETSTAPRSVSSNQLLHAAQTSCVGRPYPALPSGACLRQGPPRVVHSRRPEILSGILSARIGQGCMLIASGGLAAGPAVPLLAEPEFSDGTISPGELMARQALWAAAGLTPLRYDLEVAHLRADPGPADELAFEPYVTFQTVGFRRSPGGDHDWSRFTEGSTGVHARLLRSPKPATAPSCWPLLTSLAHSLDDRQHAVNHTGVRLDEMIAAWHLLCPHQPELLAAHLLSPLSDGLGPGRNAAATALRGLGLSGAPGPFGKIGHLALVTGLSGHDGEVRVAAADAWTRVALSGRLDPPLAAEAIWLGVSEDALKLSRIAEGLGHAAAEPAAAPGVAQAGVLATAALLAARPAGLHLLLEVATRASAASSAPELPESITRLAVTKNGSKLAQAARRLARMKP